MMMSRTDSLLIVPFVTGAVWAETLSAKRPWPVSYSEEEPQRWQDCWGQMDYRAHEISPRVFSFATVFREPLSSLA
jgi:hypothetical protein